MPSCRPWPLHGLTNLRITPRLAPFTQESQLRGSWYLADRIHETLLLSELHSQTRAVIIASGSEVQLALKAQALLAAQKIAVRVVSMPSTSAFDRQSVQYKQSVLPAGLPRIAVEMGVTDGWWKYGCAAVVGIDRYGESAPAGKLFEFFGFTPENVADTVRAVLGR